MSHSQERTGVLQPSNSSTVWKSVQHHRSVYLPSPLVGNLPPYHGARRGLSLLVAQRSRRMTGMRDPQQETITNLGQRLKMRHAASGLLVVIVMLGMAIRLHELDADSMWGDEIVTANWIQQDLLSASTYAEYSNIAKYYTHPPLADLVTWSFANLSGNSDFVLRLQAMLFGSLSILLAYELGRILWTTREGLIAALLLAVNAFHVQYSQEARPYALMVFLALLSLIFMLKALQTNKKRFWLGFAICTSLSLYNHYFAFLFLPAEIIYAAYVIAQNWLSCRGKDGRASGSHPSLGLSPPGTQAVMLCTSLAVIGLSYLPWLPVLHTHITWLTRPRWGATGTPGSIDSSLSFLRTALAQYSSMGGVALPLWLGLFALGLATSGRRVIALVVSWIGTPFVFLAVAQSNVSSKPRYAIFVLPICLLLVARATTSVISSPSHLAQRLKSDSRWHLVRALVLTVVVFLSAASVVSLTEYYAKPKEDWRSAAQYLESNMSPEDIILADGMRHKGASHWQIERGLSYYLRSSGTKDVAILPVKRGLWQRMQKRGQGHGAVWAVLCCGNRPASWEAVPAISVIDFYQVPIIRLSEPSGSVLQDTVSMLQALVDLLPPEARFQVHLALAEIYLRTGRLDQTRCELEMASQVQPGDPQASEAIADAYAEFDRLTHAEDAQVQNPSWHSMDDVLAFLGHGIEPESMHAGGTLHVTLFWQTIAKMEREYSVFVHVVGPDDRVWAQHDELMQHDARLTPTWEIGELVTEEYQLELPPDTPPGEYIVKAGVYYWETGERLPVWDENGRRVADDAILLGSITVDD